MCDESGFTIIELVVVIAIIAILMSIATLDFSRLNKKSQIESETRQVFHDVLTARQQALYTKNPTAVLLQAGSYIFKQYSSESDATGATVSSQSVKYQLTALNGSSIAGQSVMFDSSGVATPGLTMQVNPSGSGAAIDCIIIDTARTSLGVNQNGTCVIK